MEIIRKQKRQDVHPYIPELKELYRAGRISRRDFLRNAALLGMSVAGASSFLTACGATEAPPAVVQPTDVAASPQPPAAPATGPRRGGTIRVSSRVMRVDHPARYSWMQQPSIIGNFLEYLTYIDEQNVAHPYLAEKWEASEDLKTWTVNLVQGITFNNGDPFNADDVVFTMKQWLNPEVGSSFIGLMTYLQPDNIEKVDEYTVRLHLDSPQIAVPEHLFHYPGQILNSRTFEGDILKAPHGTGPFTLQEYTIGERAILKRRDGYWKPGADGQPLPYLDEIIYVDLGEEASPYIAAFEAGETDKISTETIVYRLEIWNALKDNERANVIPITTATVPLLRMRSDREPWSDVRVRQAFKLCQNREKILNLAYFGEGMVGHDTHVAPVQPEYCEKPIPAYDPERAKALLAEAGYESGLQVKFDVVSEWSDAMSYAEILKEDSAPAGFDVQINTMPEASYWDIWTETDLAVTYWTHRPLAVMLLPLAYTCDAQGAPVPWNETRWCDEEFSQLVAEAQSTLDIEKRRELMCKIEDIQMERGSVGVAFWKNIWSITDKKFQNSFTHPTWLDRLHDVWLGGEA